VILDRLLERKNANLVLFSGQQRCLIPHKKCIYDPYKLTSIK